MDNDALESIGYFGLVWQIVLNIPLFLVACAVLPDEVPPGPFDLDNFYFVERRYIGSLLAIFLILDIADATVTNWPRILANPISFLSNNLSLNLILLAALGSIGWSQRKWVHWIAFAVIFATACWGFSGWSIGGLPAIAPATAIS